MPKYKVTGPHNVIVGIKTHKVGQTIDLTREAAKSLLERELIEEVTAEPKKPADKTDAGTKEKPDKQDEAGKK